MMLEALAADINGRIEALARGQATARERAKQMRLSISLQLKEARQRVADGEAGEVTWEEWHTANIRNLQTQRPLSVRTVQRYLQIGAAEDPEAELDRQHEAQASYDEIRMTASGISETRRDQAGIETEWANLLMAWNEASLATQARFRRYLAGEG